MGRIGPLRLLLLLAVGLVGVLAFVGAVRAGDDAPARLDRVTLRNGSVFEGRIVEEGHDAIVLALPSETGGEGRMRLPRDMITEVVRGSECGPPPSPETVRDAWYLLRSDGRTVGTRHLVLRRVLGEGQPGWHLEEEVVTFGRGPHVPEIRRLRSEDVDLAFFPRALRFREVDEAAPGTDGPPRYERVATGPVKDAVWTVLVRDGDQGTQKKLDVPSGVRGRLGTREHLLRSREAGVRDVAFVDEEHARLATARAGFSSLGVKGPDGDAWDEFVWEEDGVRLVSRFREAEVLEEWITEGVVAVPATAAQAKAASEEARRDEQAGGADLVRIPEIGLTLRLPGDTWKVQRVEGVPGQTGSRRVASLESRFFVADVRVEWDPSGARAAPGADEAEARLLSRLRLVCPDLEVLSARADLGEGLPVGWKMVLRGTLHGEKVRTVAVVVDRGEGRVVLLAACPDSAWGEAGTSIERLLSSLRTM